jgi:Ca-activated chloride channel family protein
MRGCSVVGMTLRNAIACVALSFLAMARADAQQPAGTIRVSVERVNAGVIVTDSRGNFVEGLRREDFHVFDDGVEQPVTDFATIEEPAQILLMVEAGPAVYFLEASHLRAAHALLDGLSPGDRVAVVKYDEAAQGILDFTPDKLAAEAALGTVSFNLGFGMLNLSSSVSTVLDWLTKVQGKKTLVLLSTGVDTSPVEAAAALKERAAAIDVRILAVSLSAEMRTGGAPVGKNRVAPEKASATAQEFAEGDRLLTTLTLATGGRVYFPKSAKDFAGAYAEIAQLVRHEYSLAFAPPINDGKVHSIEVRVGTVSAAAGSQPAVAASAAGAAAVDAAGYRVDYRRAYVAPAISR